MIYQFITLNKIKRKECYCGNTLKYPKLPSTSCNYTATGSNDIGGGVSALSVYAVSKTVRNMYYPSKILFQSRNKPYFCSLNVDPVSQNSLQVDFRLIFSSTFRFESNIFYNSTINLWKLQC